MVKKLLTFIMGLGLAIGAQAQINQEDILMWVGPADGDATAVVAITWSTPDTGLAWGVRYYGDDGLDPISALQYIAAGDPRFSYTLDEAYYTVMGISALNFNNGTLDLSLGTNETPCVYVDDIMQADPDDWGWTWCDEEEGSIFIAADCYLTYSQVAPVEPLAEPEEESTIAASDIIYWVGTGADSAIFVLDWGTGARAWGYLFNSGDTIGQMISDIDLADPRFANAWGMIAYTEYPIHADLSMGRIKANGTFANESTLLTPGMIVKFGTPATNVWDTPITPATISVTPVDAVISADEITYWTGSGVDSAVIAFNWGDPDTALAWGLLFNGPLTVHDAILALVEADSRLYVDTLYGSIQNVMYSDGTDSLFFRPSTSPFNTIQFVLDGDGWAGWDSQVVDGSFLKVGESGYAIGVDTTWYGNDGYPSYVTWPTKINPVSDPNGSTTPEYPDDATIDASQILYWVGTGSNQVILAVNWADTALAWGFRFSADATTVQEAMDSIQAADPRFSYVMGDWGVGDILFARAAGDTLRGVAGSYWETKHNGIGGDLGYTQTLVDGDLEKWAQPEAGIVVDSFYYEGWGWSYIYVYTMEIHPVSVPTTPSGIEAVAEIDLSVYPNPASEVVNVSFEALRSNTVATIYDAAGRQVYSRTLTAGTTGMKLEASAMPEGIYLLRIGDNTAKVLIRH